MRNFVVASILILFHASICFGNSDKPTDYISREEALILADAVYEMDYGVSKLPQGWTLYKSQEDNLSGLKYAVYIRTSDGQRVLSFAGTRNWTDWRNNIISSGSVFIFEALSKTIGSVHLQYDRALQATLDAKHENKYSGSNRPLIVVGDSKGGGHIEYVGAMTQTLGIARNSAPLGNELLSRISDSNREWANKGGILRLELTSDPVSKLDVLPGSTHLGLEESYRVPVAYREAYKRSISGIIPKLFAEPYYKYISHTERDLLLVAVRQRNQNQLPSQLPTYSLTENTKSLNPKNLDNVRMISSIDRGSKKTVIFGYGPVAQTSYDEAVRRLGEQNVKIVHSFPSNWERQQIARDFGADSIQIIRHESYREITRAGVTQRIPLSPVRGQQSKNMQENRANINPQSFDTSSIKASKPNPQRRQIDFPPLIQQYYGCSWCGGGPPPPPPGGGDMTRRFPSPVSDLSTARNLRSSSYGVGGVMLQGAASVSGGGSELGAGNFSLIFENGDAGMDIDQLRKFITALWAVYFSKEGPGISIDPIAPGIDKHLVRYIGQVINSDLGRVMREADYLMKKWAVGTERPDLPNFRNPDDIAGRKGVIGSEAWSRFWFVPEEMRFKKSGNMLLFEDGHMKLKTEYLNGRRAGDADPTNEEWAAEFTASYPMVAERYPVYQELFEYAKMVSLAKYLKENNVPMLWYLLSNKDMVLTEDSPGTVDALARKSAYFEQVEITGGVDLAARPQAANYVIDEEAAKALYEAMKRYGTKTPEQPSLVSTSNVVFETGEENYTLTPSNNLILSGSSATGETYQTDLALRHGDMPAMELVRYYDPDYESVSTFGKGWHLMIPYKLYPAGDKMISFRNAVIPERIIVKNLLSGHTEILTFSESRYSIAGYVPDEAEESGLIGLFLLSDLSYRLADKVGSEFQFDQAGNLTDMILTNDYVVHYEYGSEETTLQAFPIPPFHLKPVDEERVEAANVTLPKRLNLMDSAGHVKETFIFDRNNKYGLIGYSPHDEEHSPYQFLALLTDGSFQLEDKKGGQMMFDRAGGFEKMMVKVVKSMSQGRNKAEFDYQYKSGGFQISTARVLTEGVTAPLYSVMYYYGDDGRLARVRKSTGEEVTIKYHQEKVSVASR